MLRYDRPLDEFVVLRWPKFSHRSPTNPDGEVRNDHAWFTSFAQRMINRLMVGWVNGYGCNRRYRYLTRIDTEMTAYHKTGNKEHLVNAANYCYLESIKPEHPKAHWDTSVKSVTREEVGRGH